MPKTPEEVHADEVKAALVEKEKADKVAAESTDAVRKALDDVDNAKRKLDSDPTNSHLKTTHKHAVEALAKAEESAAKATADADAKVPKQEYLLAPVGSVPDFIVRNGIKVPQPLNETNSTKFCAESVEDAVRAYNTDPNRVTTRKMLRVFDCLANVEVPLVTPVPAPVPVQVVQVAPVAPVVPHK